MENIFEGARFGEIYVTKDGKKNSFCSFCNCNGENVARLYREGWGLIIVRLDGKAIGGLEFGRSIDFDIIEKWGEQINKEELIKKACNVYAELLSAHGYNPIDVNNEVVRMKKELEE